MHSKGHILAAGHNYLGLKIRVKHSDGWNFRLGHVRDDSGVFLGIRYICGYNEDYSRDHWYTFRYDYNGFILTKGF